MGRYFEEYVVGQVLKHEPSRTVTETDNLLFCAITMNPQPLHLDYEFGKQTEFGRPIVNGLYTLALAGGLSVYDTSLGTVVANLSLDDVQFLKPVFVGDTITAETEVLEKRESRKRPDAGIVRFEQRARNQNGEVVARWKNARLIRRKVAS